MSSRKMRENTEHMRNYVQAVFAERLKQEGFQNPENRSISWYRVKNSDIINTITFFSRWNKLPLMPQIGYGIHPLFAEPIYSRNAFLPDPWLDNERFAMQPLVEENPDYPMEYVPYGPNAWVYAPGRDGRGIYTLEKILLPQMDAIHSIADCYEYHKARYLSKTFYTYEDRFNSMSTTFIDEVIYVDDREIYPLCAKKLECSIRILQEVGKDTLSKKDRDMLNTMLLQRQTILEHDRETYLTVLRQKKAKNIARIQKSCGIANE